MATVMDRTDVRNDWTRDEIAALFDLPFDELMWQAQTVHRAHHAAGQVQLSTLLSIKTGGCPEDCGYCSQSAISDAPVDKYKLMGAEAIMEAAERAIANKATRLCMVASMRGPSDKDVGSVAEAVRQVKSQYPQLELCACLGLLKDGQAETLEAAGVDAYNHNLNTSERHYGEICSTHGFTDRLDTVRKVREAGISSCSGALFGMGETHDDVLEVAYRLRELQVESIPINFLVPIKGTPMVARKDLTPVQCLKILCLFRLLNPRSTLRIAGGRELHLRALQPLGLYAANSLFVGDCLTTAGQAAHLDIEMIRDMGFEIIGDAPVDNAPESLADRVHFTSKKSH